MSKTVQVRDLDGDVYAAVATQAADAGLSVPELLRREITRIAARPSASQWLERTGRRPSRTSRNDVIEALDDLRGG